MTRHHSRPSWLLIAFVCATAATGVLGFTRMEQPLPASIDATAIVTGKAGSALQTAFDKAVPFRDAAVSMVASLRYAVFGEGFPGVLLGSDHWLFSTEEFEQDLGYLEGSFDEAITRARDELASRGMALVICLVPSKARVCSSKLGNIRLPDAIAS
ncbi:MAG: hypothetical protein JXM71_05920, partial [Spirochaetales bacterium]|nr:hypothetical protein [Spirochaetales bacterium]